MAAYRDYFAGVLPMLCASEDRRHDRIRAPPGGARAGVSPARACRHGARPDWDPRALPAAAIVMLAARAMISSRHVPWLGDRIDMQVRDLLGVGPLPRLTYAMRDKWACLIPFQDLPFGLAARAEMLHARATASTRKRKLVTSPDIGGC
ncbi:MAG: hypothetical protein ABR992_19705 [Solirubrobacteraceae bacterium]